jgi:hypothetical protein
MGKKQEGIFIADCLPSREFPFDYWFIAPNGVFPEVFAILLQSNGLASYFWFLAVFGGMVTSCKLVQ